VAQENWIEALELEEPGAEVSYEPVGSGQGRRRFVAGEVAYAATDTPLEGPELQQAVERCEPGQLVEVPAYLSSVAIVFNIETTSSIHLTPQTLARIFDGEITRWRDPAIRRENPSITVFHGPIALIYPAGRSGTTASFTGFLSETAPRVWRHGVSETWPEPAEGTAVDAPKTAGVISRREGTIGIVDASQAGELGLVAIKIGETLVDRAALARGSSIGAFERSPEAKDLKASPYMLPVRLERPAAERGTYPIVFTSYLLACTAYDSEEEANAVRRLLSYAVSPKGQEAASLETGADPLTGEARKRAEAAVRAIE
jgi:phosphate transport system substrate-binding protein